MVNFGSVGPVERVVGMSRVLISFRGKRARGRVCFCGTASCGSVCSFEKNTTMSSEHWERVVYTRRKRKLTLFEGTPVGQLVAGKTECRNGGKGMAEVCRTG